MPVLVDQCKGRAHERGTDTPALDVRVDREDLELPATRRPTPIHEPLVYLRLPVLKF